MNINLLKLRYGKAFALFVLADAANKIKKSRIRRKVTVEHNVTRRGLPNDRVQY